MKCDLESLQTNHAFLAKGGGWFQHTVSYAGLHDNVTLFFLNVFPKKEHDSARAEISLIIAVDKCNAIRLYHNFMDKL